MRIQSLATIVVVAIFIGACSTPPTQMDAYRAWNPNAELYETMTLDQLEAEANQGASGALLELGLRLMNGDRTERDELRAIEMFSQLSANNDPRGYHFLGTAYVQGAGVEKDEDKAVELFRVAANAGYDVAQYWLGYMLSRGRGVPNVNWEEAVLWFQKSAEQGNPDAQFGIAEAILSCRGNLKQNYELAGKWFRRAERQGHSIAAYNLRRLIDTGVVEWQDGDPGERPEELEPLGANSCELNTKDNV